MGGREEGKERGDKEEVEKDRQLNNILTTTNCFRVNCIQVNVHLLGFPKVASNV